MVVALDTTQTPAAVVGKAANAKEPRFAAADLVKSVLGVEPTDGEEH
jgi:hypothetical protein